MMFQQQLPSCETNCHSGSLDGCPQAAVRRLGRLQTAACRTCPASTYHIIIIIIIIIIVTIITITIIIIIIISSSSSMIIIIVTIIIITLATPSALKVLLVEGVKGLLVRLLLRWLEIFIVIECVGLFLAARPPTSRTSGIPGQVWTHG